jgi:hypothetical protein
VYRSNPDGGPDANKRNEGVGGPTGSKKAPKACTEAIRHERLRMQARQGAAINKTVGPTLIK